MNDDDRTTPSSGDRSDPRLHVFVSRRSMLLGVGAATVSALLGTGIASATEPRPPSAKRLTPGQPATTAVSVATTAAGTSGRFARVRISDDEHRLNLSYPVNAGSLTGQLLTAPGEYGLDFTAYPSGATAAATLQELFTNTPFSFLGFYFATTGHPGTSWVGQASGLLAQGWALVPIYVGRQQYWPHTGDNQISSTPSTASAQGTTDGAHAVSLARTENFLPGSRLFLSIGPTQNSRGVNVAPSTATVNYIKAWLVAVANGNYTGVLSDSNSHWTAGGKTLYEAAAIKAQLGSAAPTTWVASNSTAAPPGVSTSHWPMDNNGDVCPVAIKEYSNTAPWQFASFASAWQFNEWAPGPASFLTDAGVAQRFTTVAPTIDLSVATAGDPATTQAGKTKSTRRRTVAAVAVSPATIGTGQSATVTITLSQAAPAPNGETVLLRSASPDLLIPTSIQVTAGQTTATTSARAAVGAAASTVTITARNLHQLTSTPPSATLKITT